MSVNLFFRICDESGFSPSRLIAKGETLSDKYDRLQQSYRESRCPRTRHAIATQAACEFYGDVLKLFPSQTAVFDSHSFHVPPVASVRMSFRSKNQIAIGFREETKGVELHVEIIPYNYTQSPEHLRLLLGVDEVQQVLRLVGKIERGQKPPGMGGMTPAEVREHIDRAFRRS